MTRTWSCLKLQCYQINISTRNLYSKKYVWINEKFYLKFFITRKVALEDAFIWINFKKTTLTCSRILLMKIKNVKNLDLETRWFDDMKDLNLKMFWFKILICLKRLRVSRMKKLMIEFKSDKKEKWSDSRFKALFLSYILNSIFDNIIMVALNNRMLNDPKFDAEIAI